MSKNYASLGFKSFLITFLVIVAVACVIGGITYSMEIWGGHSLPDVVGMTQQEAEKILDSQGFKTSVEEMASDEEEGTVVGTNPEAGTRVDKYTDVILYIAVSKTVPNVCGMTVDEATTVLNEQGYNNIEIVDKASDKEQGTVLEQEPRPKAKAKSDEQISLTVATPHIVPDVAGMSEADAKSALANAGYKYYVTQTYSEDVSEGNAIGTNPPAGDSLKSSKTVELLIAKSRSKEVEEVVEKYLKGLSRISVNGRNYEVSEVNNVSYDKDSTCNFTITIRPYESHSWFGGEPETRYGNYEKLDGTITVNDKNEVSSTNPSIAVIS